MFRRGSLVVLLALTAGCGKKGLPSATVGNQTPVSKVNLRRPVELTRAEQRIIVSNVEQVGSLEARQTTEIAAGVTGVVDAVLFDEGAVVSPDDKKPLVQIDQEKYLTTYESAVSAEAAAKANYDRAKDVADRAKGPGGAFSQAEQRQTDEMMKQAEAQFYVAKSNLKLAKHNLVRSQVPAPYRGQMNQKKITPGSYVKEDTIIGTIADLSEIRVVGYVPESVAPLIRERTEQRAKVVAARSLAVALGSPGGWGGITTRLLVESNQLPSGYDPEFSVPSLPRRNFRATIFYMSTVADPTTHMFECKARIDGTDPHFAALKPGFTARIRFPYESTPDAVVVPEESVRATERGFLVFVVEKRAGKDGPEWVAKSRRIEPGARSPGWVEVKAGLSPGEWLVQRGAEALDDGVPVRVPDEQVKAMAK
ncbi:efflux RND transporter periplasmic adaptor subunit [Limnoglobus roseus]|uniref:Efflux RND transporter periplasmic adaptor subunit n=1 Tax=Limnoglobus roseus TaxID=2598579 RepID=A0A5C1A6H0_9BACT|nr:efflux RND transporter periplasmic adaptor subunit [Limnoglobus roseus]QEL13817.1 efflux RND transporter periplasmic adaptor subunit [Limnoglobus roseus]